MNISPLSERTSAKGIPPAQPLEELEMTSPLSRSQREEIESDRRLNHSEEQVNPVRVPIHFCEGTGYAGALPTTNEPEMWPGPLGGAFIWLSCGGSEIATASTIRSKQTVKLHRIELQIPSREEETIALYSCRAVDLQRTNPTVSFIKSLFKDPRRTMIHPVDSLSGFEGQKRSDFGLMVDFPFGALGGRDPHPVIWNNLKGKAVDFDPKSLKSRNEQDLLRGGASAVGREPVYDATENIFVMIQRTDGIGSDSRYSQFRLIVLMPNFPRLATFMAPRSLSMSLLAIESDWMVCSAVHYDRRLFYLISKREGRLMAVYQSSVSGIKKFVSLAQSKPPGDNLTLIALLSDGSLRKYLFTKISVEVARFDGAAGLLTVFPVVEFETVSDGPFDQVSLSVSSAAKFGYFARSGSTLLRLTPKFTIDQSLPLAPLQIPSDFSLFPLSRSGQQCLCVLGIDPYSHRVSMNLIDGGGCCEGEDEMNLIAKIGLGIQTGPVEQFNLVPPIYIPTKINK